MNQLYGLEKGIIFPCFTFLNQNWINFYDYEIDFEPFMEKNVSKKLQEVKFFDLFIY